MVTNMIPKASRAHLLFLNKVVQHTSKWKGLTIITILSFGRTREENISFSFIYSCVACWGEIIQGFVQHNPENCSTNLGGGRPLDSTDDSNTSSSRSGCPWEIVWIREDPRKTNFHDQNINNLEKYHLPLYFTCFFIAIWRGLYRRKTPNVEADASISSVPKWPVYGRARPSRRAFGENSPSKARIFVILPVYMWFWARSEGIHHWEPAWELLLTFRWSFERLNISIHLILWCPPWPALLKNKFCSILTFLANLDKKKKIKNVNLARLCARLKPVFLSKKGPSKARLYTKMSLSEELGTLWSPSELFRKFGGGRLP